MSAKRFSYPFSISKSHLDFLGHVNNAVYFKILEEARLNVITMNGFGMDEIKKSGLGPIMLEANVKFIRELRLGQHIVIETWLDWLQKKIALIHQQILDGENKLCCEALFKFGLFNTKTRRLVSPTKTWAKALGLTEDDPKFPT